MNEESLPTPSRIAISNPCSMRSRRQTFPYPYSMPGALACKAAERERGPDAHWDMLDRIQRAHATEARNIVHPRVLADCAVDVGFDRQSFLGAMGAPETRAAVDEDIECSRRDGISAVPSIIIEDRLVLSGAQPTVVMREALEGVHQQMTRCA